MKIVPFRRPDDAQHDALVAELEAALSGESAGAEAESWRELRSDVRELAPPMSPELERELWARIEAQAAPSPRRAPVRLRPRAARARFRAWLASGLRARLLATAGAGAMLAIVVVALVAPWQGPGVHSAIVKSGSSALVRPEDLGPAERPSKATAQPHSSNSGAAAGLSSAKGRSFQEESKNLPDVVSTGGSSEASSATSSQGTPASAAVPESARVQQLGASLTLAPKPAAVQSVAGEVAQLAARDGGFVQSSNVHVHGGAGEANLTLSLPSARLSAALASLGRLAPMRAESQSLQDITDEYDADRTKLADAVAERQALLRALAKAGTQGAIESLHARLALAAAAITRARGAYAAVSKRGSNSAVEVTVVGDAHANSSASTLHKALDDALDVLRGALAVLIVAAAVLVPLAVLLALFGLGRRATRRRLRERALS